MKLSFDMNYDKSTQAFKINLQPRSNFPKEKNHETEQSNASRRPGIFRVHEFH